MISGENRTMDVFAAARSLNQKAAREHWHHIVDPTLAFSDASYDQLLNLWRTKAGNRKMPRRSEITPRDLKDVLRHLLISERVSMDPSQYRWKLIGTSLTSILGEHTGKTFEESIPPEHVSRWNRCGDMILDGGQPLRFLGRVHINGRDYLDAENLFVPLANDNDIATFGMGLCRYMPRRNEDETSWENQLASIPGGLL
jgi:hypothetical protein